MLLSSSMVSFVPFLIVLTWLAGNAITENGDCRSVPCHCCKGGRCSTTDQNNSTCAACLDGFTGPSCYEPCPAYCITCSQQFYSEINPVPVCYKCKTGFYNGKYKDMKNEPLQEDCSLKCEENCNNCSSFSYCHLCKPGYYLNNNNFCQKCTDHCDRCNSSADCIACENGYGWTGGFCRQCKRGCNRCKPESYDDCSDCGSGYYMDNFQCIKCVTGCQSCAGHSACNDCEDGFLLTNGSCSPCQDDNCTSCTLDIKSQYKCISCKTGFMLNDNKCKEIECERGFLREGKCTLCPAVCTQCSSDNNCSACVNDKYGETCMRLCSPHCFRNTCNDKNGICTFGCVSGYSGIRCEISFLDLEETVKIIRIVVILVAIQLVIILIYCIYRARKRCLKSIRRKKKRSFQRGKLYSALWSASRIRRSEDVCSLQELTNKILDTKDRKFLTL